jgi:hypothetical protein
MNLKINAHLQKSNGIIEIRIEFKNKLYNEKFKQFLDFYWIQQLVVPHSRIERSKNANSKLHTSTTHVEIHSNNLHNNIKC